jgi:hypothetical protein
MGSVGVAVGVSGFYSRVLGAMAMRYLLICIALACCTPPAGAPPVLPDASDGGPCGVDQALTRERMIRTDTGAAAIVPCHD